MTKRTQQTLHAWITRRYTAWCIDQGRVPFPASPGTMRAWLEHRGTEVAALGADLTALRREHARRGVSFPLVELPRTKTLDVIMPEEIRALILRLPSKRHAQIRAALSLLLHGLSPRDLRALSWADVRYTSERVYVRRVGGEEVAIPRWTKSPTSPAEALRAWSEVSPGPKVFRPGLKTTLYQVLTHANLRGSMRAVRRGAMLAARLEGKSKRQIYRDFKFKSACFAVAHP